MHSIPDRPWLRAAHSALVDAVEIQPVDVGRALFNQTHNYPAFITNILNGHLLLETLTDEPPVLIVSAVDALGTAHVLTHLSGPMLGLDDGPALAAAFTDVGWRLPEAPTAPADASALLPDGSE